MLFRSTDAETKEDKVIFHLSDLKATFEVYVDKKKYFFLLKDEKEKIIKDFSLSDKKLGNNTSSIEVKQLFYSELNQREELILNLGYNGATAFIYSDNSGINIEILNPIGETVKNILYFYEDFLVEE